MKKKMVIVAAAMLALTGCSLSDTTAATAAQTEAATTTAAVETSQEAATEAESAAETEDSKPVSGSLTIYTSQPEADIQALVETYNKNFPDVKVEIFRSGTEEVVSKVLAEKQTGSVLADVLLVSDAGTFEELKKQDLLMSYESPELEGIDSSYYDSEHTYTGTKLITTGIVVNTELIDEVPTALADLTKDIYKDELIMPSPLYSGAASYNLSVITRTDGLGWDFYQGLKDNGVKVDKGNGTVQTAVVAGEKGLGILVDYMAVRSKADGAPVEFVYPEEGSLCVTEPIGIINGTAHEEEAKSFVDFILSEEGQIATAKIGYTPVRAGIDAPEGLRAADEITNLSCDMEELVAGREADKEEFSKMFE